MTHISSTLGWKRRFMKPMDGLLNGYSGGSVTCTFHAPPSYGADNSNTPPTRKSRKIPVSHPATRLAADSLQSATGSVVRLLTLCRAVEDHAEVVQAGLVREVDLEVAHHAATTMTPHDWVSRQQRGPPPRLTQRARCMAEPRGRMGEDAE